MEAEAGNLSTQEAESRWELEAWASWWDVVSNKLQIQKQNNTPIQLATQWKTLANKGQTCKLGQTRSECWLCPSFLPCDCSRLYILKMATIICPIQYVLPAVWQCCFYHLVQSIFFPLKPGQTFEKCLVTSEGKSQKCLHLVCFPRMPAHPTVAVIT